MLGLPQPPVSSYLWWDAKGLMTAKCVFALSGRHLLKFHVVGTVVPRPGREPPAVDLGFVGLFV